MAKVSIADLDLTGKRVLIRVDFNVPLDAKQEVTDDTRIRAALPTIRHALGQGAKVLLISHLGRPKGKVVPSLSLAPAAARLSQLLGQPVAMASDCMGDAVKAAVARLGPGQALMLENCRFHAGDEKNDEAMGRALAALCDVFVNDAFGAAHRAHASTVGVTKFVPTSACGFLMAKELEYLGRAVTNPARPFVAVLGGAKVSDKIGVLKNLVAKVDVLLVGGGMAYTFLKAQGMEVGASLLEADKLDVARAILDEARAKGITFLLPMDHVVAERAEATAATRLADSTAIPPGWMGLDIGPKAREAFTKLIRGAKTVVWNGPMGVFELAPFREGTFAVARAIAASGATSIVGGGDSVAAVAQAGVADKISHISTGGGASLEFLEGIELPGVAALTDKH
ncbi:MAG: phosphoglycerate kinase [candidate division NC10 bacterium]|nr:phosphoglycerate kinase [candidate division NC10 bacterium]MBI3087255.1 phosphoglycerate kinase [candidate division NC10 bacterium]